MTNKYRYPNEPDGLVPILIAIMIPILVLDYSLLWWWILTK